MAAEERTAADTLRRIRAADPAGAQWLAEASAKLDPDGDRLAAERALRVLFARISRNLRASEQEDLARFFVLRWVAERYDRAAARGWVEALYRGGALHEQGSILRALGHLPTPGDFVDLATEACRTNAEPVFTALAHDNPFPARFMPPSAFAQMVLKAIFMGVGVRAIVGLQERVTPELLRMIEDYASERRAAGRDVPSDIAYIQALAHETTP